jgi:hypothetical protein
METAELSGYMRVNIIGFGEIYSNIALFALPEFF